MKYSRFCQMGFNDGFSLLSLYDSVLVPILCDWIYDSDLCCLDTAVCNSHLRPNFLSRLGKCSIVNPYHTSCTAFSGDKEWMLLRSIKLQVLVLSALTPAMEAVLKPHLQMVDLKHISQLDTFVNKYLVDEYRITLMWNMPPLMVKIGMNIVHIEFLCSCSAKVYAEVAVCCPLLRSIHCCGTDRNGDPILPLVDNCLLNFIERCNLHYLLQRKPCKQTVLCDLIRVPEMDSSAVYLSENKFYHVTAVHLSDMIPEDVKLLSPLLPNVTSLTVGGNVNQAECAIRQCHRLKALQISHPCTIDHAMALILPTVEKLTVKLDCDGSAMIRKVAVVCSHLQKCSISFSSVDVDALDELTQKCKHLNTFERYLSSSASSVMHMAVNITSLQLKQNDSHVLCLKDGRCGSRMIVSCDVTENMVRTMVRQNCWLKEIVFFCLRCMSVDLLDLIVRSCPLLTSISISTSPDQDHTFLNRLADCTALQILKLEGVNDVDGFMLVNIVANKQHLTQLTLSNCKNFGGELLICIAETCPLLQVIRLCDPVNQAVMSEHVIELVKKCPQLHTLIIMYCPNVTESIVPFLLASSVLKTVCLTGCKVDNDKLPKLMRL